MQSFEFHLRITYISVNFQFYFLFIAKLHVNRIRIPILQRRLKLGFGFLFEATTFFTALADVRASFGFLEHDKSNFINLTTTQVAANSFLGVFLCIFQWIERKCINCAQHVWAIVLKSKIRNLGRQVDNSSCTFC